ncbi:MAG: hypothetical protein ABW364_11740 [Rhodococcus fascians]|jgi:hypothetical protein
MNVDARHRAPRAAQRRTRSSPLMSYLLYDALLPQLGHDIATYWATLLVINPA